MNTYCAFFGISRQAYYQSLTSSVSRVATEEEILLKVGEIRRVLKMAGTRKLQHLLEKDYGILVGRDRLNELLRKHSLLINVKRSKTITTDSKHGDRKYPSLIKDLVVEAPEEVFVSDITYIRVAAGFMYLFLVTDIYSKQIMGYSLSSNMRAENGVKALREAIRNKVFPDRETIHHSDCGSQYCSALYTSVLKENSFLVSMTEENHCYENSVAERINGILKQEFGLNGFMFDENMAQQMVREAIVIYNTKRPHLSCGMLTPAEAHISKEPLKNLWSNKKKEVLA